MNGIHDDGDLPETLLSFDLNLALVLDALLRERNVTRAAQRVGMTQSAMSHALKRLRTYLGDPVLVRGQGGMVASPRAEGMAGPLRQALLSLGQTLARPTDFNPQRDQRTFRIATPDAFDLVALPRLCRHLQTQAPSVSLTILPLFEGPIVERLERGEIDMAVLPQMSSGGTALAGGELRARTLLRDHFVCLLRRGHPALGTESQAHSLSLKRYAELHHVLVSPTGRGPGALDQALAELKLSRRIAMRVPNFATAVSIVAQSDMALAAPSALSLIAPKGHPLQAVSLPLKSTQHTIKLVWHARYHADSGHQWMREQLFATAQNIPTIAAADRSTGKASK